ncbi:MAG: transporter substrate-binding domain-containing protein [Fibromonadales bacterium]|nr:transporter substrate-binding domain-containing protein [Fibromonadales bacterium]
MSKKVFFLIGLLFAFSFSQASYRDLHGITEKEINAIEILKGQKKFFTYGMMHGVEAFYKENGEVGGYSALFCEWLTDLFGIPFKPSIYGWDNLMAGLDSGKIDFVGVLTPTEERKKKYYMTDAIAQRTVKYFQLASSPPISRTAETRTLRFATFEGSTTYNYAVSSHVYEKFDIIYVKDLAEAHRLLESGEVDAFLGENTIELAFDVYGDMISSDFFPLLYNPVSVSAIEPELEPVIAVIQKALRSMNPSKLAEMYKLGELQYRRHKLYMKLTEEERAYIRKNPIIPFAAEFHIYPISFYNKYEKEWQGIYFDLLNEMTEITGMNFKLVNDEHSEWSDLQMLLEKGNAYVISELIPTEDRRKKGFFWPHVPSMTDKYALLSKSKTPNISLKDVLNTRIGLARNTAYSEMFRSWFPNHNHTVEYANSNAAFKAMENGEIDFVMASLRQLLTLASYYEYSGYKANLVFDYTSESYIGFNKDQAILCSIFNKAFQIIDVNGISEQWKLRTYNYDGKIAQAQRPWLIGATVLLLSVLVLVFILFFKMRSEGKQSLATALKKAEAANRAKSTFLAKMSNEIRAPMNAIIGMADIVLRKDISKDVYKDIIVIKRAGANLLSIINDILNFSKIESGKLELVPKDYLLSDLVNDVASIIKAKLVDSEIRFDVNVDSSIPNALFGDEMKIRQVLLNLLGNAVKYTKSGLISFSVNGKISEDTVHLTITIADSGIGIKHENIEKIFRDFDQSDSKSAAIEGTGLGLSITKSLVTVMGGSITVHSEYGKGSSFTITLPQKTRSQEQVATIGNQKKNVNVSIKFKAPEARVLVVDDVDTNLYVIEGLLSQYKMQVDLRQSGAGAIEAIKAKRYDLVLMDHLMSEMDGIEATRRIRELGLGLPVIALSANAVSGAEEMFMKNGFNAVLSKPIEAVQLNAVLERWIPKGKQEAGNQESELNFKDIDPQMLAVLRKDVATKKEEIEKCLETENYHLYTVHVHGLKSAFATIGANKIFEDAKALEMAGHKRDAEFIKLNTAQFLDNLTLVLKSIDARLGSEGVA